MSLPSPMVPALPCFEVPGAAGGLVRHGKGGPWGGDALLMDTKRRLFAVADSPPRAGNASYGFLHAFRRMAARSRAFQPEDLQSTDDMEDLLFRVRRETEVLMESIPCEEASTFTGLLLAETKGRHAGLLLHAGDSLLFQFTPGSGVRQISRTNFWMVGRSRCLFQAEVFPSPPGSLFLLATDGLFDLAFPNPWGMEGCLARTLEETPVEKVPEVLLERYDPQTPTMDDLALVAIRPEGLGGAREDVFVGR